MRSACSSATLSRVRQKTMARSSSARRSTLTSAAVRSPSPHRCATWRMSSCAGRPRPVRGSRATASRWKRLASARIPGGSVAEKSSVRRSVGVASSSVSSASRKPRSSISSASSRTSTSIAGQIERAPLDEIDEPARRADDDVDAVPQRAQRRRACRCRRCRRRSARRCARTARRARAAPAPPARASARPPAPAACRLGQLLVAGEQHAADDEPEGDGLARAGLRRDQKVRLGCLEHARLHRRRRLIVALAERLGEGRRRAKRREVDVRHGRLIARPTRRRTTNAL